MENKKPNIFTIAPSSSFFREMVLSLLNGTLVESFQYDPSNPLSLASITIYVPTKRAIQALRSEFTTAIGEKSIILPVIKPLGDIVDENFNADFPLSCNLNPPISNMKRLLELARLILAWRNQFPNKIKDIYPESPLILPASPADAIWLAKNLADIIDVIEIEEKKWEDLYTLENDKYGMWWLFALDFLKIASEYWKDRLFELSVSSAVHYQIALMRAEAEYIAKRKVTSPIIVAGSTGSMPATARLMSAVASDPNGAIVLPGVDVFMPSNIWDTISEKSNNIAQSNAIHPMHPQYSLSKLLNFLKIKREDVKCLGIVDDEMHMRSIIISKSFFPSGSFNTYDTDLMEDKILDLQKSFSDVALIEASNEREEATSIAIALRMSLDENKKKKSALITADRNLARRVKLELIRFGIDVDISAGIPLSTTLQGSILTSLLNAVFKTNDPMALAVLIKHPLATFGFPAKHLFKAKNALELIALRGNRSPCDIIDLKSLVINKINEQKNDKYIPRWRSRLSEEDKKLSLWLADHIVKSIAPLAVYKMNENSIDDSLSTPDWTELTAACLQNVCLDENKKLPSLWLAEEGKALSALFSKIIEAGPCIKANAIEWIDIITALIAGETVKPKIEKSSTIFILGTLESRLLNFDTLILGGLNEGVWPKYTPKNPFLSRMMQSDLGLETAEKYIGQAAHDFEMASGTRHLIYTRSLQENNIPTVASRWLQRLLVFGGNAFSNDLKKKGERYLDWARRLDDSTEKQIICKRPRPFPPLETQPKTYSFSEIKKLISDPYAIYAQKILKLDFMPRFKNDPNPKDRGILFHKIVTGLIEEKINKNTPEITRRMKDIIDSYFEKENLPPHIDIIWRYLFHKIALPFLEYEEQRQPLIEQKIVNVPAKMKIDSIGIHLTGIADRIDILKSGYADIIDYKTGNNPTKKIAQNLIDPQLSLEAVALKAGSFSQIECREVGKLVYIRLKLDHKKLKPRLIIDCIAGNEKDLSADELSEESLKNFIEIIKSLQSGKKPFISHLRFSENSNIPSEYDHLARVEEWKENYDAS
ncbi:double-strand break repair protein AddB [Candidatus Liberibacter solanacearum]|uniref:Double-strand break repair protein AddB n=1 Tax=Candidatus Liberibacter solanacearum TaxID=556287 RepID=A0A424FNA8_9HYPH|nr:double-strand break repair protein AddB [Candidatus Liberibacter solanacearum]RPD37633.1 double-strand break repair protein AddB [Candidatus Liberibacter solanacearum]